MVNEHLSRLAISRILVGEIPHTTHSEGCPECQAAVAEARSQSESIAQRFPTFESLDTVINRRRAQAGSQREASSSSFAASMALFFRRFHVPAVSAAFAAILVLGLGTWVFRTGNAGKENDLAAKGHGAVEKQVFFLFRNGTQAYGDSLDAGPSDTLQLGIVSPRPVHYAVLYRDDGAALGAYMGGSENKISPLGNPQGEPLPKSLILDGDWKQENLYCVWSDRPFTLEEAMRLIDGRSVAGGLHLQAIVLRNPSH